MEIISISPSFPFIHKMLSKTLFLSLLALSTLYKVDAFWTVTEKSSTKYGEFWAELTEVHYNGNSTEIRCTVDIQPAQDSQSITYEGHTAYVGCSGSPLVSLYGENRVLKHLRVLHSQKALNCIIAEHTPNYKEYVCGNAVPNDETPSNSTSTKPAPSSSSSAAESSKATYETCILGYLGKRNGKGPNGACCTHSNDCLDTCVKGVCGVTP